MIMNEDYYRELKFDADGFLMIFMEVMKLENWAFKSWVEIIQYFNQKIKYLQKLFQIYYFVFDI